MNQLTKDFSIAIQIDERVINHIIQAQHVSGIMRHRLVRIYDGKVVEILINRPLVSFQANNQGDNSLTASAAAKVYYHSRIQSDNSDIGNGVIADVTIPTIISIEKRNNDAVYLNVDPTNIGEDDIIITPHDSSIADEAKSVLLHLIKDYYALTFNLSAVTNVIDPTQKIFIHVLRQNNDLLVIGIGEQNASSESLTEVESSFLQNDWAIAFSAEEVLRAIRESLNDQLPGNSLPPPLGNSPVLLSETRHSILFFSYTRRTFLQTLNFQLHRGFILAFGNLKAENSGIVPDVSATFSARIHLTIGLNQTLEIRVGQINTDVHGFFGDVLNFFSGGDIERAVSSGIRDAFQSDNQQGFVSGLISSDLLSNLASLGSSSRVNINSQTTSVEIRPEAVILHGEISVVDRTKPSRPVIDVFRPNGSRTRRIFFIGRSWSPGGLVSRYELDFDNGTLEVIEEPNISLVLEHNFAPGVYDVCLSLVDDQGQRRTTCVPVETARLELTHEPFKYKGDDLPLWQICLSEEELEVEFFVVDKGTKQPIEDAIVSIEGNYVAGYSFQASSDAQGKVGFRVDPSYAIPGRFPKFHIRARKDGYLPVQYQELRLMPCDRFDELVELIDRERLEELDRLAAFFGFEPPSLIDPSDPSPPISPGTSLSLFSRQISAAEEWQAVSALASIAGIDAKRSALQDYLGQFSQDAE